MSTARSARAEQLAILYELTSAMARGGPAEQIYDAALDTLFRGTHCDRAAILLFDAERVMRFVASRGLSDGYKQAVEGHTPWSPESVDAQPVVVEDIDADPDLHAHRATIAREGIRSLVFIPLFTEQRVIGKFMLYYDVSHVVGGEELRLAETIARHVAFALERSRAELALADSERKKDEFLATLAHELRNPLAAIRSGLHVVTMPESSAAQVMRAQEIVQRQVQQMTRLVDDLLDVSRITQGRINLQKARLDLRSVITEAVDASRARFEAAEQTLLVSLPSHPVEVDGDSARLAQVCWNLLTNAEKFTPAGGQVSLTLGVDDAYAVVTVRDSGIGMTAQQLPRIFEMFCQAMPTGARAENGLGIGLSLARGLVQLHGGLIEARSEGPGHGSEFIVRLPLATVPMPIATDPPSEPAQARKGTFTSRRILIVDDHIDSADMLETMLQLDGHQTRSVREGRVALRVAPEFQPQIVLLDIGLPDMSGYDVAREMRSQSWSRGVALIALTGWGQADDKRRATEAGFDVHLTKPVNPTVLSDVLADIVRRGLPSVPSS